MPIAKVHRTVNAPRDYCWDWLADFGALDKLHPPGNLTEFRCEGSHIGARRFARFKPELGVDGQIVERLDVVNRPNVLAYSIVENYPLPMRDYVAVVTFAEAGAGKADICWEGHYTEAGLAAAEMNKVLQDFYELFLGNIEKAHANGCRPGERP